MLRVAMLAYTYYRSDPRVRREAEALAARGDEVEFYCLRKPGEPRREHVGGVGLRHLPLARYRGASSALYIGSYLVFFFLALGAISWSHLRRPYRLVHANNMPDFMVFAALLPRLSGGRVILDIHDTMPEIYQGKFNVTAGHPIIRILHWQERLSAAFAHRILTSEHTKKDALVEHGIAREKIEVLLNLPDPAIFKSDGRPAPAKAPGEFRLVFHGTLAPRLGVDLALRAVARLRESIPGLRLDLIGDGDQLPALHQLARELDIADCVEFSDGFVPVDELPPLLARADLAVIPTRDEISTRNMLPTKLVEYAALGIPALVSPTHTIRYYFDEEQVAFFEAGNEASLAREIAGLYGDPERRRKLAAGARRFFERYRWDRHKQVYLDLVDGLTGS